MNYVKLKHEIENAPLSWCPALLIAMVKRCLVVRCFNPGAIEAVVQKLQEDNCQSVKAVKKEGE